MVIADSEDDGGLPDEDGTPKAAPDDKNAKPRNQALSLSLTENWLTAGQLVQSRFFVNYGVPSGSKEPIRTS
jgi:hypothetical protein